ncbi:hypothetical protein MMC31_008124, partial [Peltigera leucophlebia]|nr:hypothetical protein [Peltigera leucophlebia]
MDASNQSFPAGPKHLNVIIVSSSPKFPPIFDLFSFSAITQIGGSLAGLFHGIMLKKLGHNVRILEQSVSSVRESQAAGITAGPDAQKFLSEYDHCQATHFLPSAGVKVFDKNLRGRIYSKVPLQNTSWDVLYYRLRANYDAFKSEHVPEPPSAVSEGEGKVTFDQGKRVTNLKQQSDESVIVEFDDLIDGGHGEHRADLIIAADGANSIVRRLVFPNSQIKRPYSGYVAWRGTVPEREISEETNRLFGRDNGAIIIPGGYMMVYTIPGANGSIEAGECLLNLVWYQNHAEESLQEILTDSQGKRHHHTLPAGKMQPEIWARQQTRAVNQKLPLPFLELVQKIKQPFITAVSDTSASQASFLGGKLLLVGDALTLFRPHVGLGTNQGALHALLLRKYLVGEISLAEWETRVLEYANVTLLRSIAFGAFFQYGWVRYFL